MRQMSICCTFLMQGPEDGTGQQRTLVDWQPVLAAMALSYKQKRAAHEARLALGEPPPQIVPSEQAIGANCVDVRKGLYFAGQSAICTHYMHALAGCAHVLTGT